MRVHQNTWGRVSRALKRDWKRDEEVWSLCNNWGFWCGCWWMHRWTMAVPMCMCSGFPTGRSRQMIMTSLYDIMRVSHAIDRGNYKMRAWLNLRAAVIVIWVSQYNVFGFISKPQTLYLGCLGSPWGGSIMRMDSVTYLSICMHPDLSGGLSVSVTLIVWLQLGRSLPSPINLVLREIQITTLW